MPLPLRTLRVLPNPWAMIHPDNGPQGVCVRDSGGRANAPLEYLGATVRVNVLEARDAGDPRGNRAFYVFAYPSLTPALDGPAEGGVIDVPAKNAYYRDRLQDGSLVPADAVSAKDSGALYTDMKAARAAGIKEFESHFGAGTFAEAFKGKPFVPSAAQPTAAVEAPPLAPPAEDTKATKGGKS